MTNQEITTKSSGPDEQDSDETPLETHLRIEADAVFVSVTGEVDMNSAASFKAALIEAGAEGLDVIVDLSGVNYMDSSGFGAMLSATYPLRPLGAFIHLIGVNAAIARMLEITRLNTIFVLHNSEADALAAIRATSP